MKVLVARAAAPFAIDPEVDCGVGSLVDAFKEAGWEADSVRIPFRWGDGGSWAALQTLDLSRTPMDEPVELLVATDLPTSTILHPNLRVLLLSLPARVDAAAAPFFLESLQRIARRGTGVFAASQTLAGRLSSFSRLVAVPKVASRICHPPLSRREPDRPASGPSCQLVVIDPQSHWRTDLILAATRSTSLPRLRWMVRCEEGASRVRDRLDRLVATDRVEVVMRRNPISDGWGRQPWAVLDLRPDRDLAFPALAALDQGTRIITSRTSGATAEQVGPSTRGWCVEETPRALRSCLEALTREPEDSVSGAVSTEDDRRRTTASSEALVGLLLAEATAGFPKRRFREVA